jgi:hypothetical protein
MKSEQRNSLPARTDIRPATPLPWLFGELSDSVMTARGHCVAQLPDHLLDDNGDLAYIAHAANAYPKLVEALRQIEKAPEVRAIDANGQALVAIARETLRELGELK